MHLLLWPKWVTPVLSPQIIHGKWWCGLLWSCRDTLSSGFFMIPTSSPPQVSCTDLLNLTIVLGAEQSHLQEGVQHLEKADTPPRSYPPAKKLLWHLPRMMPWIFCGSAVWRSSHKSNRLGFYSASPSAACSTVDTPSAWNLNVCYDSHNVTLSDCTV